MLSEKSTIQAYRVAYFTLFATVSRHPSADILRWHHEFTLNYDQQLENVLKKMKEFDNVY